MKKYILVIVVLFYSNSFSQEDKLYTPIEIQSAYESETRNKNGKPGDYYWINKANYTIKATIDTATKILTGIETIVYHNNSFDELDKIVLRLYQDIYKKGTARDFEISMNAVHEGVEINKILIRDKLITPELEGSLIERKGTHLILKLEEKLGSKDSVKIYLEWKFKIPVESPIRMGAYDETTYFVALWYPQISVYDDINGWDLTNYTGQQEFYNDFNNFDVEITMPDNFLVWGTGDFINPDMVLNEKFYEKYNESLETDEIIRIVDENDYEEKINKSNVWKFKATKVPDFAFATSDRYLWDQTTTTINSKKIIVKSAYNKESLDFYEVASITKQAVELLSTDQPKITFPYNNITVFKGGGSGMEFPMMINDNTKNSRAATVGVTVHELIHQYFPFAAGTNERKYAWMDEGWARMIQFEIQKKIEPSSNRKIETTIHFSNISGREFDVPLITLSSSLKGKAYRPHAYTRSSMAYEGLKNYLGKEKFIQCLQEYYRRWEGKHPTPYDFFYTFNEISGENLAWFWKPWFFEFGYPDLGIKSVNKKENSTLVLIEKVGNLPTDILLTAYYKDGTEKQFSQKANVWKNGNNETTINIGERNDLDKLYLENLLIPDVNSKNNYYGF